MKLRLIAMMAIWACAHVAFAQGDYPLPGDNPASEVVSLQAGVVSSANDSLAHIDPIPAPKPGVGNPKAPARPLMVGLSGHTLYTGGLFDGYTLYVISGSTVAYTTPVWADETTIALPEWLTGFCTLVFADGTGGCYYGDIVL